jgi:hypothetical protein
VRDALADWWAIRHLVDWTAGSGDERPTRTGRDGVEDHLTARDGAPSIPALTQVRADAAAGRTLSWNVLCGWQSLVLGERITAFRTGDAFAKGGRERYGLAPDTPQRFAACLADTDQSAETDQSAGSGQSALPLAGRAARAYLDVCFFHPFRDGNGRAAALVLYFVLLRAGIVLDAATPALATVRQAGDAAGAADFARLVAILVAATRRRAGSATAAQAVHCGKGWDRHGRLGGWR